MLKRYWFVSHIMSSSNWLSDWSDSSNHAVHSLSLTTRPLQTNTTTIDYETEHILALRWKITQDSVAYNGLTFDIHYTVSDYIQEDLVRFSIYDGAGCSATANFITQLDYFTAWITTDNTPPGGGLGTRDISLSTQINTQTISLSPVYRDFGDKANIIYCMRLSLFNKDASDPTAVEINYHETAINLEVDLKDQFKIQSQTVEASSPGEETADDKFFVEAYICTQEGLRLYDSVPLLQGATVRVCVQPTPQALDIGFRMRSIDRFTFWQGYVSQEAIINQQISINGLTDLECNPGGEKCIFETLLMATFFQGPSTVDGTGYATLQFGSDATRRRKLWSNLTFTKDVVSQRELAGREKTLQLDRFQVQRSQLRPDTSWDSSRRMLAWWWFVVPLIVLTIQAVELFG
jgi:hypothetical protein